MLRVFAEKEIFYLPITLNQKQFEIVHCIENGTLDFVPGLPELPIYVLGTVDHAAELL